MRDPSGEAAIASAWPLRLGANEVIRFPVRMSYASCAGVAPSLETACACSFARFLGEPSDVGSDDGSYDKDGAVGLDPA